MRLSNATCHSDYERLRAAYDGAFENLGVELRKQQLIGPEPASIQEEGQRRVEEAFRRYHEQRDRLAEFLALLTTSPDHRLQDLAYRLWEQAGRPLGVPDQYWYQAESQLHRGA